MTFFGINLGARKTGVCIIKNDALLIAQIHTFNSPWSKKKLAKIIECYREYIKKYNVTAIMVKVPPTTKHTGPIKEILNNIVLLSREYNCKIDFITKDELKKFTLMKKTEELLDWTRRLYPDLGMLYHKEMSKSYNYYKWSFEAVLAAHVYKVRFRHDDGNLMN